MYYIILSLGQLVNSDVTKSIDAFLAKFLILFIM